MLNFEISPNGNLKIFADKYARKELAECKNYYERESLIREWYGASIGEYDYKTADEIDGNLSEAPIFASELDYSDDGGAIRFYDDQPAYHYALYMVRDFTVDLMNDESIYFNKI